MRHIANQVPKKKRLRPEVKFHPRRYRSSIESIPTSYELLPMPGGRTRVEIFLPVLYILHRKPYQTDLAQFRLRQSPIMSEQLPPSSSTMTNRSVLRRSLPSPLLPSSPLCRFQLRRQVLTAGAREDCQLSVGDVSMA